MTPTESLMALCDCLPPRVKRAQTGNLLTLINAIGHPNPKNLLALLLRDRRGALLSRWQSSDLPKPPPSTRNKMPYYVIDPEADASPIMLSGKAAAQYTGKSVGYFAQKIHLGGGKASFTVPDPRSYGEKTIEIFSTYYYPL
jgi:hypothetical protein